MARKVAAFDQRVARRKFASFKVNRQDAVFDWPEQRCDDAIAAEGNEQHRHRQMGEGRCRMQDEPARRDGRDWNLSEFQPACDKRFVEAVGQLAAERREHEEGRHQHSAREGDQSTRSLPWRRSR